MLAKSTSKSIWRARSAAAGTSTITPTVGSPAARACAPNQRASATVDTIGAMTHG